MSRPAASDCFAVGQDLLPLETALARLRQRVNPAVGQERIPLAEACGRILAEPLVSPRDVPAFDNVAVDGWAFAGSSLAAEGTTRLRVHEGRAAAGHPFEGQVPEGAALRALTGAVMPRAADTVAMQEEVRLDAHEVVIPAGYRQGQNRRRRGEDIRAGQTLFETGVRLLPQHIGVAAELGLAELPVFERLKVAIFSSGDEIREPGASLEAGEIFDANRYMLKGLLQGLPVEAVDVGILPDDEATVRRALADASSSYHAILTSGGASGGDEDHVVKGVGELGSLHAWRIAIKPGRPLGLGQVGRTTFIGLPGNPVAVAVCFLLIARPVLMALAGAGWHEPRGFTVNADFSMKKKPGRTELLRSTLDRREDGSLWARRILREGSGILTSMTDAQGLVRVPSEVTRIEPGEPVEYLSFAELGLAV